MDAMLQMQADRDRRIQERRQRIQERLAALREGETAGPVHKSETKQMDPGKEQSMESVRNIMSLRSETSSAVHTVPLQSDAAENARRIAEEERRQDLRTKMLAEAEQSARKNASVAMHWADLFAIDVPQDLWKEMQEQQKACDTIIQSKNDLIAHIKKQLKVKDNDFTKLLKQQTEDISTLLSKMNEQVDSMSKACELDAIEEAYVRGRKVHLEQCQADMAQMFETRTRLEQEFMERYLGMVEGFQKQLFDLQVSDAQDFNALKVRLENDRQNLEQHMEAMLATYQLNIEKLDYNYRVLVERDHENTATINQQKRKIARQRDHLTTLKARYHETDRKLQDDNMKLTSEYKRITEQFKDLQLKFRHFELVDSRKYDDVWRMKEEEVVGLARKVMAADRVLHEQQLGLRWRGPGEDVLCSPHAPEVMDAEQRLQNDDSGAAAAGNEADEAAAARLARLAELRTLREDPRFKLPMDMIADEAGFLLEPKARERIAKLPADEARGARLDALLEVLGVTDVHSLEAVVAALDPTSDIELRAKRMGAAGAEKPAVRNPPALVPPDEVVKRLRAFVEAESASLQGGGAGQRSKAAGPRAGVSRRTLVREREFWRRAANVVDDRGLRVWAALERNLEKYYGVLQDREAALRKVESLGQQNGELRALLNQYLSSQINSELQVPPTQLI